jgi:hypothetical protein
LDGYLVCSSINAWIIGRCLLYLIKFKGFASHFKPADKRTTHNFLYFISQEK